MAEDDLPPEESESAVTEWRDASHEWPNDPWAIAAYRRIMDMDRMLLHVCHARNINEQVVMDALGTETTPEYVSDETFVPFDMGEHAELLYLAYAGRAIAAMGGQLEVRAVFPDQSFLLLAEPGPEHMNDDTVFDRVGRQR